LAASIPLLLLKVGKSGLQLSNLARGRPVNLRPASPRSVHLVGNDKDSEQKSDRQKTAHALTELQSIADICENDSKNHE